MGAKSGFLSIGVTAAVLRATGTEPEDRDMFITVAFEMLMIDEHALRGEVGTGSSLYEEGVDFMIRSDKERESTGAKQASFIAGVGSVIGEER